MTIESLIVHLTAAAGTRADVEALAMIEAAETLDRQQKQINSLLRAVDLMSEEILQKQDKTLAILIRHLGDVP
jgi:hypothetical protein